MTILISGLGITGYKSFGADTQYLEDFSQINVIIGKNNSGKSNILQAIRFHSYVNSLTNLQYNETDLNSNFTKKEDICFDYFYPKQAYAETQNEFSFENTITIPLLEKIQYKFYPFLDTSGLLNSNYEFESEKFKNHATNYVNSYSERYIDLIVDRFESYASTILRKKINKIAFLPAIRSISSSTSELHSDIIDHISGPGLIRKIHDYKHPSFEHNDYIKKIESTNKLLSNLLEENVEIDYSSDFQDLFLRIGDKRLPLSSLGTGLHQLVLLSILTTIVEDSIVCIEEPELYLHPSLQRKFIHHLFQTSNQYFITSHANTFLDIPDINVYHCSLENDQTKCHQAISSTDKNTILDDLGYKASDLLQTNFVIWVEGPSDRIYINQWISLYQDTSEPLKEGFHYSIMFYGGRLLSHLTAETQTQETHYIQLLKLNRNMAIVIDSDIKEETSAKINETKQRIQREAKERESVCWITEGKEIENYIPEDIFSQALKNVHGENAKLLNPYGKNNIITKFISTFSPKESIDESPKPKDINKIKVAKAIIQNPGLSLDFLDLNSKISELCDAIKVANKL